jgi:hypothetical protein
MAVDGVWSEPISIANSREQGILRCLGVKFTKYFDFMSFQSISVEIGSGN